MNRRSTPQSPTLFEREILPQLDLAWSTTSTMEMPRLLDWVRRYRSSQRAD